MLKLNQQMFKKTNKKKNKPMMLYLYKVCIPNITLFQLIFLIFIFPPSRVGEIVLCTLISESGLDVKDSCLLYVLLGMLLLLQLPNNVHVHYALVFYHASRWASCLSRPLLYQAFKFNKVCFILLDHHLVLTHSDVAGL